MYSLTRRPALSRPIITPGINRCGPFHKLGKFCKVGSICSSALSFSDKLGSLPSSSPSDSSSSNLQDSLRSERQGPSTRNSRCCKSIGVLEHHDKPLDGLPPLPRVELANLNRNGISSKRLIKKHDPSKTTCSSKRKRVSANRSYRRIEKSGSFNERNAKYRVAKKKHNKRVSEPLPSMKVSKRRLPVSTSRRNKKSKLNDLFFYHAINQEEPDIVTVEHAGVQGGVQFLFPQAELKPLKSQDGQDVEVQSQQKEDTLWSRVCAGWKTMPTWKKTATVVIPSALIGIGIGRAGYLLGAANCNLSLASASHGNVSINNCSLSIKEGTASMGDVYPMNPHVRPEETTTLTVDQNDNSSTVDNRRSLLMDAAENGHLQVVKELLETNKANPNQLDRFGDTALMYAAKNGHLQVVEKLIESGATVNHPSRFGWTALMYAARHGHLQVVEKLIDRQANVHLSNVWGQTALMYAAENGHLQVVEKLIESKAKVNQPNRDGDTALMYAAEYGHLQVVEKLIESKAEVNRLDKDGDTALMIAITYGNLQVVEKLIGANANVNPSNNDGDTALMIAATYGHLQVVEKLIGAKAEVNHSNNRGWTALMNAANHGRLQVVEKLIESGAKVDEKNHKGETALTFAARYRHSDIEDLLRKSGGKG